MLVLAGRGTKVQVCFLAAYLNPLGLGDARRVERSVDEVKHTKICWTTSLEDISFGSCDHRMRAQRRRGISSRFNRGQIRSREWQRSSAREVSTCTDSSTRSEQISHEDELWIEECAVKKW